MSTEYRVRIDRTACEGVFACLVRDDRFVEATDGLVTIDPDETHDRRDENDDAEKNDSHETIWFADDRIEDARLAARACPVDAIDVTVIDDA